MRNQIHNALFNRGGGKLFTNNVDSLKKSKALFFVNSALLTKFCFLFCVLMLLASCKKDGAIPLGSGDSRFYSSSCEPGSYSVSSGILVFDTVEDFETTMNFLNCADDSTLNAWVYDLPMDVAYTMYEDFSDAIDAVWTDSLNVVSTISAYSNKVTFVSDGDSSYFEPKYKLYPYFIGGAGYFRIDDAIIAEEGEYIISIPDGNLTKLADARISLETDTSEGIFVHRATIFDEAVPASMCCPNSRRQDVHTISGGKQTHRVRNEYRFISRGYTLPDNNNSNNVITHDHIDFRSYVSFHRRGFFGWWYSQKRSGTFSLNTSIVHPCQAPTSNPVVVDNTRPINNRSTFSFNVVSCIRLIGHNKNYIPPPINLNNFCIEYLEQGAVTSDSPIITNIMYCNL